MLEQGHQVGIVAFVEHDEADIDRPGATGGRHVDRAGMPAEAALALVDYDLVAADKGPGSAQARDAGADDSDFHFNKLPYFYTDCRTPRNAASARREALSACRL